MSPASSLLAGALALLACTSCSHAQLISSMDKTNPLPVFASQYSTVVAVNNDTAGYTVAYNEYYDSTTNVLVTKGRYNTPQVIEIVDLNTQLLYAINTAVSNGTAGYCQQYNISSIVNSPSQYGMLQSLTLPVANLSQTLVQSVLTSQQMANMQWQYIGTNAGDARGITTRVWQTTAPAAGNSTLNYSFNFYAAEAGAVAGLNALDPVRLQLNITNTTTIYSTVNGTTTATSSYSNVSHLTIDFVSYSRTITDSTWFTFYQQVIKTGQLTCSPQTTSYRTLPPSTASAQLGATPPAQLPGLPNQFTSVLEVKLNGTALGSRLSTLQWALDGVSNKERVDYTSPTVGAVKSIYDDTMSYVYSYDAINGCIFSTASGDNASPIQVYRAGALAAAFKDSSTLPTAVYVGKVAARGIMADVWRIANQTRVNNGDTFKYTMDLYYFPLGWQFPGRPTSNAQSQLLMRINNYGTYSSNVMSNIQYNDIWDWYQLLTVAPPTSMFDYTQYPCNNLTSKSALPMIPTHYTSTVSANINDKGYTLAYTEYYDSTLGLLRNDGKFASSNVIEVIDYTANSDTLFYQPGTAPESSAPCQNTILKSGLATQPSIVFFQMFNISNLMYMNQSTAARGILCDVWQGTLSNISAMGNGQTGSIYTATYYFAARNSLSSTMSLSVNQQIPVRVTLQGLKVNADGTSSILNHVYDWVNFLPGSQDPSLFVRPSSTQCYDAGSTFSTGLVLPLSSQVQPLNPSNPPSFPTLTSEFSAVFETKLGNSNAYQNVSTVKWYFDAVDNMERVDTAVATTSTFTSYIYKYSTAGSQSAGDMFLLQNGQCTGVTQSPIATPSPLTQIRAGSVPSMFWNASAPGGVASAQSTILYGGRSTTARGITADVYTVNNMQRVNAGYNYTYNTTLYFAATGWQYPGRPAASSQRLPIRIVNTGSYISASNTTATPYTDQWDIFAFVPGESDWMFTTDSFGCPDLHSSKSIDSQTVAMGALMGVLLGVIIIGGGSYLFLQRMKAKKEAQNALMRLQLAHEDDDSDGDSDDEDGDVRKGTYAFGNDDGQKVDYSTANEFSPSPEPPAHSNVSSSSISSSYTRTTAPVDDNAFSKV